jgi:hypothetical protein
MEGISSGSTPSWTIKDQRFEIEFRHKGLSFVQTNLILDRIGKREIS